VAQHPAAARVTAVYPDMEAARRAMRSLEQRGIEAASIHLLGGPVEHAIDEPDVSGRDIRLVRHLGGRVIAGGVAGAVVGAGLGAVVAAAMGGSYLLAVVIGVVFIGGLGLAWGGYATLEASESWELTFQPDEVGQVGVGVESPEPEVIGKAVSVLESTNPVRVMSG
jgi:hypothetical protein